jgi:hypothetical protein
LKGEIELRNLSTKLHEKQTGEQKVLSLANRLLKELDKLGHKYINDDTGTGHVDIWVNLCQSESLEVNSILNHWQIVERKEAAK